MVPAPASINREPKRKERCRSALIMRHCPSPSSLFPAICSCTSFLHRLSSPRVLYTRIFPLTDIRGELFEHHPSATGANGVNDRWKIDAVLSSEISLSLSLCMCTCVTRDNELPSNEISVWIHWWTIAALIL